MKNHNKRNKNTFCNTFCIDKSNSTIYNKIVHKSIGELIVEWDKHKNVTNIKKHKLSFETASLVFADENRVELYDFRHSKNEDRYRTIGMVNNIITVIYTERKKTIRIISARNATAAERKQYYGKNR